MRKTGVRTAVVVPNWNGADSLVACLDSLFAQSVKSHLIVVDNGSQDSSVQLVETKYPAVELIKHTANKGFAGGINPGFRQAMELGLDYVATFNNDAVADKDWLKHLIDYLDKHPEVGIVTPKLLNGDGKKLDSTGDFYTVWGLPYPRGRGEADLDKYDQATEVFGASGGASLYRTSLLRSVGLFDEDFFAYYEDVDLSFRAQLAGWKVTFVSGAVVYHQISATSSKLRGFATYQTMKNLQLLYYKNVPKRFMWRVGWRLCLAQCLFIARAFSRREGWAAVRGDLKGTFLMLKKRRQRRLVQTSRVASDNYIWGLMVHDLPTNAKALRKLRSKWWRLKRKGA
jgi:GT2 family glycosyltransferase